MSVVIVREREDDFQPRPPRRTTTNLSVDFIESSISLAEDSRYVAEIDRFVSAEEADLYEDKTLAIWKEASLELQKLDTAVQQLREKTQPKHSKHEVATPAFTWKQVVAEVETATELYKNSAFVRICDKSGMFEQWLSLLPNDSYSAVISGAFVMGVQAARSLSGLSKSIYEALASIPDVLDHAGTYIDIYKAHRSSALVSKTASLCKAILTTLRLVIEFITKGSLKRFTGAMLKGSHYQEALKESIEEMKVQALRVREEASVCMQRDMANLNFKIDTRARQEQLSHALTKEELSLQIDAVPEATAQLVLTHLLRSLQSVPGYNVRTGGPPHTAGLLSLLRTEDTSPQPPLKADPAVTVKSLSAVLDFDPNFLQEDMDHCLTLGFRESPDFQDRAAWVMKASQTSKFLASDTGSKLLIVNGNHDAMEFISPLSYVCAKLADYMSVSEEIICLTYFCSRHTHEWREPRANAQGLLAQLIGQLLPQLKSRKRKRFEPDLSSLSIDDQSGLGNDDFAATWRIFEVIIRQLPKGTVVVCFIDALTVFENTARRQDTNLFMKKLSRLIRKAKNVDLRCMVTYPGRSNYWATWGIDLNGRNADKLEVPEYI
ncbi:hypothetical protein BKA63DRAFT_600602 [Paraphoma chrysanthemicola]|nr:hypothetical protein BKA63DRAFT_600602 [Paraphoma chrysanthemicola]